MSVEKDLDKEFQLLDGLAKKQLKFINAAMISAGFILGVIIGIFTLTVISSIFVTSVENFFLMYLLIPSVLSMSIFSKKMEKDVFGEKRLFYVFYNAYRATNKFINDRSPQNKQFITKSFKKLARGLDWWAKRKSPPDQIEITKKISVNTYERLLLLIENEQLTELQSLLNPLSELINSIFINGIKKQELENFNNFISTLTSIKKQNKVVLYFQTHRFQSYIIIGVIACIGFVLITHFMPNLLQGEIYGDLSFIGIVVMVIIFLYQISRKFDSEVTSSSTV